MKKLLVLAFLLLFPVVASAYGNDVYVNGYTRDNGTYVQPHMRTAPDNTTSNNYSTYGNTNPYTGQPGTKHYDNDRSGFNSDHNNNSLGRSYPSRSNNSPSRGW
ncbi:hypothetical protein HNQ38_002061 [Desulfovibrio intestinalis]|uniref:Uncharacterized protein n=1 Tax=Desulfovibrio intestinalis TaxID=58621 RepID=A0A7W8FGI6_9BACT|nr:hypothetical protein [Desulfovibrio intestinalis]